MEALDLLWDIESQWTLFDSYKIELEKLKDDSDVKVIEKKIQTLKRKLTSTKNKQEKSKIRLLELEKELKNNNFNFEELEKELYDGHTTDIKQLEYLNGEKDKIKDLIDNIEVEVIELIGTIEEADEEIKSIESELGEIIDQNSEIKDTHESKVEKINTKITSIEKKIKQLEGKIDDKLINEYNRIRKSRKSGIAELKDSVCLGCNITIPTFFMEKIKNTKDIFHCESCGRILYHKEI